eukprot:4723592-Alexandrium_andersonii.AAC.1
MCIRDSLRPASFRIAGLRVPLGLLRTAMQELRVLSGADCQNSCPRSEDCEHSGPRSMGGENLGT